MAKIWIILLEDEYYAQEFMMPYINQACANLEWQVGVQYECEVYDRLSSAKSMIAHHHGTGEKLLVIFDLIMKPDPAVGDPGDYVAELLSDSSFSHDIIIFSGYHINRFPSRLLQQALNNEHHDNVVYLHKEEDIDIILPTLMEKLQ